MNFGGSASDAIYGVGKAGGQFDWREYVKRPTVILNIVAVVMGIFIFRNISNKGYHSDTAKCIVNDGGSVCAFMELVSMATIIFALSILSMEVRFGSISSVKMRRRFVMAELFLCAVALILSFIGFCYLIHQWNETKPEHVPQGHTSAINISAALNFLLIIVWLALAFLAYQKYTLGAANAFNASGAGFDAAGDMGGMPAYATTYPGAPSDQYQDPPFAGFATSPSRDTGGGGYQSGPY